MQSQVIDLPRPPTNTVSQDMAIIRATIIFITSLIVYGVRLADDPYYKYSDYLFKKNGDGKIPTGLEHGLENIFSSSLLKIISLLHIGTTTTGLVFLPPAT